MAKRKALIIETGAINRKSRASSLQTGTIERHRYISTTKSYLQNDMEGLKEETNQYHPL